MISSFHVNMGKYLPKMLKVCERNECHIDKINYILHFLCIGEFGDSIFSKVETPPHKKKKKIVADFWHRGKYSL